MSEDIYLLHCTTLVLYLFASITLNSCAPSTSLKLPNSVPRDLHTIPGVLHAVLVVTIHCRCTLSFSLTVLREFVLNPDLVSSALEYSVSSQ